MTPSAIRSDVPSFQSTHPQGCDQRNVAKAQASYQFQSTHPQGCDWTPPRKRSPLQMFQSTHPQGCDPSRTSGRGCRACFNPRTRKGATQRAGSARGAGRRFNPRTRKGATSPNSGRLWRAWFQSTHPQGCDSPLLNTLNPAPEKGDQREPPQDVMPWYEHDDFVKFN